LIGAVAREAVLEVVDAEGDAGSPHIADVIEERPGIRDGASGVAVERPGPEDRADLVVGDRGKAVAGTNSLPKSSA
jgi:hypothetical protein